MSIDAITAFKETLAAAGSRPSEPTAYASQTTAPAVWGFQDGDKFAGGFGATEILTMDYWTLRQRSDQLFRKNLYARGLLRRLVTNEINTGVTPETSPVSSLVGVSQEQLNKWSKDAETRYELWSKDPRQCDFRHSMTLGEIQRTARLEALIDGDVLVVLRQSATTGIPMVQLIRGSKVVTPFGESLNVNITHGVERDAMGRDVAYWVQQDDGTVQRLRAWGARSGRRMAWLLYGTDRRLDDVRGEPLLSIVLQSLREIDRYRDSAQRKAVVNSLIAMFIKKDADKQGTRPISAAATRRGATPTHDDTGTPRTLNAASLNPGISLDELQTGEEPVLLGGHGTDTNFGAFEDAIIQAVAWANEVPPEILKLAFTNNYSASQAAINEFKIYLNKVWTQFGDAFCQRVYTEWLIAETLKGRIESPGMLDAWRDPQRQDVFCAWTSAHWYGSIKVSTDMLKQGKGSSLALKEGMSTRAREARGLTGTKYSDNVARLVEENTQLAAAWAPLAEFKQKFGMSIDEIAAIHSSALREEAQEDGEQEL